MSKKEELHYMSDIRKIIQDSMKEQDITSKEARKCLGKRYERGE